MGKGSQEETVAEPVRDLPVESGIILRTEKALQKRVAAARGKPVTLGEQLVKGKG